VIKVDGPNILLFPFAVETIKKWFYKCDIISEQINVDMMNLSIGIFFCCDLLIELVGIHIYFNNIVKLIQGGCLQYIVNILFYLFINTIDSLSV
jgi:hypothetical protein